MLLKRWLSYTYVHNLFIFIISLLTYSRGSNQCLWESQKFLALQQSAIDCHPFYFLCNASGHKDQPQNGVQGWREWQVWPKQKTCSLGEVKYRGQVLMSHLLLLPWLNDWGPHLYDMQVGLLWKQYSRSQPESWAKDLEKAYITHQRLTRWSSETKSWKQDGNNCQI